MKKKKNFIDNVDLINKNIITFSNLHKINDNYVPFDKDTFSWFDIKENLLLNNKLYHTTINKPDILKECTYKCKQIQFFPTDIQKNILDNWIELYRKMMNKTIHYYKKEIYNKNKLITDYKKVRSVHLLNEKEKLYNNSDIYSHSLDYAIKDVCTNMKSIITNLKNKNINHFRIRYIKQSKPNQLVKIEKTGFYVEDKKIISKKFGILNTQLNDTKKNDIDEIDINKIDCDLSIIRKDNRYYILLPIKIQPIIKSKNNYNKVIGLDAGIWTFLTGFSQDNIIEIGNNLSSTLNKRLNKIDKINNLEINKSKKKKATNKRYRKIQNQINDLHWKSINYLTTNYDEIILGKLSTSSIVRKSMNSNTKRIAMMMRSYVFRERLKYKKNSYDDAIICISRTIKIQM
jgi:transposase